MKRRHLLSMSCVTTLSLVSGCVNYPRISSDGGEDDGENEISNISNNNVPSNDMWELCKEIAREPTKNFDSIRRSSNPKTLKNGIQNVGNEQAFSTVIDNNHQNVFDKSETSDDLLEFLNQTDFSDYGVLLLQWGPSSSLIYPKIKRIVIDNGTIHAYGCISEPRETPLDETIHLILLRFRQTTDNLEKSAVSIILSDRWFKFDSTDGIVGV